MNPEQYQFFITTIEKVMNELKNVKQLNINSIECDTDESYKLSLSFHMSDGTTITTNKVSLPQAELTPTFIGSATSVINIDGNGNTGFSFPVTSDNNGVYIFTYGNCMVQLPIYNLTSGTEYKVTAALVDSEGNYAYKVLTYKLDTSNNLLIYQKQDFIPVGWTGYLSKIRLY